MNRRHATDNTKDSEYERNCFWLAVLRGAISLAVGVLAIAALTWVHP